MPERDSFPREYFESNPYEDDSPEEAYQKLRWGNEPQEVFEINAPEPLITLGDIAKIFTPDGTVEFTEAQAPFLALGTKSNFLYFVPKRGGKPCHVPKGPFAFQTPVLRLDYYSDKGGEPCYYYHDHESPYPCLYMHSSGVGILRPSLCADGSRSYAVSDEGIIG